MKLICSRARRAGIGLRWALFMVNRNSDRTTNPPLNPANVLAYCHRHTGVYIKTTTIIPTPEAAQGGGGGLYGTRSLIGSKVDPSVLIG
jgi:hypothetical protein